MRFKDQERRLAITALQQRQQKRFARAHIADPWTLALKSRKRKRVRR